MNERDQSGYGKEVDPDLIDAYLEKEKMSEFNVGDRVIYNDIECDVTNVNQDNGMVGVMISWPDEGGWVKLEELRKVKK